MAQGSFSGLRADVRTDEGRALGPGLPARMAAPSQKCRAPLGLGRIGPRLTPTLVDDMQNTGIDTTDLCKSIMWPNHYVGDESPTGISQSSWAGSSMRSLIPAMVMAAYSPSAIRSS